MPSKKAKTPGPRKLRDLVQEALADAKALDVVMLDVRGVADFTDYMVVCTGTSNRHVQSVADKLIDQLRAAGRKPIGVEGEALGDWVLIDFGEIVVHVMRQATRDFYNLEKLWSEGKLVKPRASRVAARKTAAGTKGA
ncbi:MAG: ribosome silencing factor [Pseudomonadota bacterium]|nr:MAG: ribosome silencing factor [Pseudomonadota bacterium]